MQLRKVHPVNGLGSSSGAEHVGVLTARVHIDVLDFDQRSSR